MIKNTSKIGRALIALLALGLTGNVGFAADVHYYVNDPLATTVAISDAAGEIAAIESDAFGSPLAAGEAPSRYTGKPYDADLGAFVFPFRNYRPEEGRWMSADPSGFPDGVNGHYYAPLLFSEVDTFGLSGKNLIYVYFYANINGVPPQDDRTLDSDLRANVDWLRESMDVEDDNTRRNPFKTDTHYLDDGDTIRYAAVSSYDAFSKIIAASFTRIYIVAHGNLDGSTQNRFLGGVSYSHSTVQGWSPKITELIGCSISGGKAYADVEIARLESKAMQYLRE